jgi:hypothetical protein
MSAEHKLCYVKGNWAYFTSRPLSEQTGDDWNDAPYEHNAGTPYGPCWHNNPEYRNNPDVKRGLNKDGEPLQLGELCRCSSCQSDWNEDGTPKYSVIKVAFDGDLQTPADRGICCCVDRINSGFAPWLASPTWSKHLVAIPAGTTIEQFKEAVKSVGGRVYES